MPCGHFPHNGCSFSFCWHSSPVPTSVTSLKADISSQCSDAAPQFEAVPHCMELTSKGGLLETAAMSPRISTLPESCPQEPTVCQQSVLTLGISAWKDPSRKYCWLLCGLVLHRGDWSLPPTQKKSTSTRQRIAGLKPKGILA